MRTGGMRARELSLSHTLALACGHTLAGPGFYWMFHPPQECLFPPLTLRQLLRGIFLHPPPGGPKSTLGGLFNCFRYAKPPSRTRRRIEVQLGTVPLATCVVILSSFRDDALRCRLRYGSRGMMRPAASDRISQGTLGLNCGRRTRSCHRTRRRHTYAGGGAGVDAPLRGDSGPVQAGRPGAGKPAGGTTRAPRCTRGEEGDTGAG